MTVETIVNMCPPTLLHQSFDPDMLLDFLGRAIKRLNKHIIPLSHKKIRAQDVGKRKQFDKLCTLYLEEYGRKTIERERYKKEIEEAVQKRPRLSSAGGTMRFSRMDSAK